MVASPPRPGLCPPPSGLSWCFQQAEMGESVWQSAKTRQHWSLLNSRSRGQHEWELTTRAAWLVSRPKFSRCTRLSMRGFGRPRLGAILSTPSEDRRCSTLACLGVPPLVVTLPLPIFANPWSSWGIGLGALIMSRGRSGWRKSEAARAISLVARCDPHAHQHPQRLGRNDACWPILGIGKIGYASVEITNRASFAPAKGLKKRSAINGFRRDGCQRSPAAGTARKAVFLSQ